MTQGCTLCLMLKVNCWKQHTYVLLSCVLHSSGSLDRLFARLTWKTIACSSSNGLRVVYGRDEHVVSRTAFRWSVVETTSLYHGGSIHFLCLVRISVASSSSYHVCCKVLVDNYIL